VASVVAGMTTGRTLLCLEQLAWDHRLRVTTVRMRRCGPHAPSVIANTLVVGHLGLTVRLLDFNLATTPHVHRSQCACDCHPGSASDFRALAEFEQAVGADWVFTSDADVDLYRDAYSPFAGEPEELVASSAVAPASTEQVQQIVRIANRYRVPLYTISTGKNLGYGGSAPTLSGSVVLDLKRMNRILEVNEDNAYALVEPGVSYFDLYRYSRSASRVWIGVPIPAGAVCSATRSTAAAATRRRITVASVPLQHESCCNAAAARCGDPERDLAVPRPGVRGRTASSQETRGRDQDGFLADARPGLPARDGVGAAIRRSQAARQALSTSEQRITSGFRSRIAAARLSARRQVQLWNNAVRPRWTMLTENCWRRQAAIRRARSYALAKRCRTGGCGSVSRAAEVIDAQWRARSGIFAHRRCAVRHRGPPRVARRSGDHHALSRTRVRRAVAARVLDRRSLGIQPDTVRRAHVVLAGAAAHGRSDH
jgi:hypothetical protein